MDEKGWKGAELIFDIDADSIPTPCKARHTWWFCSNCHKGGMGTKPAKCPGCHQDQRRAGPLELPGVPECDQGAREAARGLSSGRLRDRARGHPAVLLRQQGIPRPRPAMKVRDGRPPDEGRDRQLHEGDAASTSRCRTGRPAMRSWAGAAGQTCSSATATEGGPPARRGPRSSTNQIIASQRGAHRRIRDDRHTPCLPDARNAPRQLRAPEDEGRVAREVRPTDGAGGPRAGRRVTVQNLLLSRVLPEGSRFGPYNSSTVQIPIYAAVFLLARGLGAVIN